MEQDKIYCVYAHINQINGKMYIGQTKSIQDRWKPSGYYHCVKFYRAIQKYGWENFEHIILKDNLTKEEADKYESYYIELYNSIEDGYNLSGGGDNKSTISDSTKKKLSDKSLELWKNEEYRERQKISRLNAWNSEYGNIRKQKMSESNKGEKNSRARKIKCITTDQVFNTIKEAQDFFKIKNHTGIVYCCQGKRKSAGKHPVTGEKLVWEYFEE